MVRSMHWQLGMMLSVPRRRDEAGRVLQETASGPVRSGRWQRGFTLVELMLVVAVIGLLAAIAIPLYGSMTTRARVARAQGDLRAIASAISMYQAHVGTLPASFAQLTTTVTNAQGVSAGPFIAAVPSPPPGGAPVWTAYETGYTYTADGQFSVSTSGDGVNVRVP